MSRLVQSSFNCLAITLVCSVGASWASAAVVAHYGFDEANGTSVADSSGNGNSGVLDVNGGTGTLGAAGQFGNAVSLSGGSWVQATNATFSSIEQTDWSVTAWVTVTGAYSDSNVIGEFSGGGRWRPMNPYLDGNVHMFSTFRNTDNDDVVVSDVANQIPNNGTSWTHLGVTWNRAAEQLKVYVNGSLIDTQPAVQANLDMLAFAGTLQIGRKGTDNKFWEGKIDEIWVFNQTLSEAQVDSLMNVNAVPEPSSFWLASLGFIGLLRIRRHHG